jgi:hypothetical protein
LEISAIEEMRAGRDLKLHVIVTGFGKRGLETTWGYFREYEATIPRSKWMDLLAGARFLDHVHVAVSAKGSRRVEQGAKYLRAALDHHARGDYAEVAQTCRKAIEEIGKAGFGKKPPDEVKRFIEHQSPRLYTIEERTAVVRMAALLLLHSGSHAGEEERRWQREDSELALALAAALLQVAPSRLASAEPPASPGPPQNAGE